MRSNLNRADGTATDGGRRRSGGALLRSSGRRTPLSDGRKPWLAKVAVIPALSLSVLGLVAVGSSPAPATEGNLLDNGTFGAGEAGWVSHDKLTPGAVGRGASKGVKLTRASTGTVRLWNSPNNSHTSVAKGGRYVATGYVRSSAGRHTGRIVVRALNSRGVYATKATSFTLRDSKWHPVKVALTAPAAGSGMRVTTRVDGVRPGQAAYVDDVQLTRAGGSTTASTSTNTSTPRAATSTVTSGTSLLSTNFDSMSLGRVSPTSFRNTLGGGTNSTSEYDDSTVVGNGAGRDLRTTLVAHTIHSNPGGNNGVNSFVPLKRSVLNACVSYRIKFDANFDWSYGGKLPGLLGVEPGVAPSLPTGGNFVGDRGWSGRLMWLGPGAYGQVKPRSNGIASYMYHPGQADKYGDNVWWNRGFSRGTWHTVKQCYKMNTVGKANGYLGAWFDGTQVVNRTNYVYRKRSDVAITHLSWSIFRGGNTMSWAGSRTDTIDVDDLRVTTS